MTYTPLDLGAPKRSPGMVRHAGASREVDVGGEPDKNENPTQDCDIEKTPKPKPTLAKGNEESRASPPPPFTSEADAP